VLAPRARGATAMAEIRSWLTDASLNLEQDDAFDVHELVERLANLVEGGDPPFTISLSGSWGVGKSTVAEGLVGELKKKGIPGVIVDAWTEDIEHLRRSLAVQVGAQLSRKPDKSVAAELDEALSTTEIRSLPPKLNIASGSVLKNIRPHLKSSSAVLICIDVVFIALAFCSAIWFPTLSGAFTAILSACLIFTIFQSGLFLHIISTSQSVAPASESVQMAKAFKSAVTTEASDAPKKALIVVDNLDRLSGDDALRALAQIRALVEVPGSRAIFLIPIDRKALARHIQSRLGPNDSDGSENQPSQADDGDSAATDYLEKFFNLDLSLIRPDVLDLRKWALQEARKIISSDNDDDLVTAVQVVCSATTGSPRSVKRILNGIAARQRLLTPSARPTIRLSQLAFIESVVTQFPELSSWLAPDGRRFMSLREKTDQPIPGLSKVQRDRLREFLLANSEIVITPQVIRLALALREDAVWRGVSSPAGLQEALDTGQPDAFRSAVASLDKDEVERAVSASVNYIERSVPDFPRDAVSALVAIGEIVGDYPGEANRLRSLAMQAFARCDDVNRSRVTKSLGTLLFDNKYERGDVAALAGKFVDTLGSLMREDRATEVNEGLVWTVRLAGRHVSQEEQSVAQEALSKLDDDLLGALFEPPMDSWLIKGPVADKYMNRLSTWDASAPDYPALVTAVDRLAILIDAGWDDLNDLRKIAARAFQQFDVLANDNASHQFVNKLTTLLAKAPSSEEVDQLAVRLAQQPGTADAPTRLGLVMRLPLQAPARESVATSVQTWIRGAELNDAKRLLLAEKAAVVNFGFDPIQELTSRWISGQGRDWLELAVEFDDGSRAELLADALSKVPDNNFPESAEEAASIAASQGSNDSGDLLLGEIAKRYSQLSPDRLADLRGALLHLQQLKVNFSKLIDAVRNQINLGSALAEWTHFVRRLEESGIKDMRALAGPLAARGSAAGGIRGEDLPWLVRKTHGSSEARNVAIHVVESEPIIDSVCAMVNDICKGLKGHPDMMLALVRRARSSPSEEDARKLLEAALSWKKPRGNDEYRDYETWLTDIATHWSPSLDGLVNKLR